MLAYIAHRLIQGVVVVIGVSFIVFALMHLTPGNPLCRVGCPSSSLIVIRNR